VRLAIESRLAEVTLLALVGADKRFIRRPFFYLGVIYGSGGALVAAMLLSGSLMWLESPLARLFASYGGGLHLAGFDPTFLLALLLCGGILGAIGAAVASHQRLKEVAFA
jgi:cell division transport system permease protein